MRMLSFVGPGWVPLHRHQTTVYNMMGPIAIMRVSKILHTKWQVDRHEWCRNWYHFWTSWSQAFIFCGKYNRYKFCTFFSAHKQLGQTTKHKGSHWDVPQFFVYITTIASIFLNSVICNCHPYRYASCDTKKIQIGPVIFSLISIISMGGAGKNVLPLKSHQNKNFQFLFQQC